MRSGSGLRQVIGLYLEAVGIRFIRPSSWSLHYCRSRASRFRGYTGGLCPVGWVEGASCSVVVHGGRYIRTGVFNGEMDTLLGLYVGRRASPARVCERARREDMLQLSIHSRIFMYERNRHRRECVFSCLCCPTTFDLHVSTHFQTDEADRGYRATNDSIGLF